MRKKAPPVLGQIVPAPRPTAAGAFWLALVLSVPVFLVLAVAELVWRVWG